jgi:hypothetical protein
VPFRAYLILASLTLGVVLLGGAAQAESPTDEFTRIRDRYIEQVRPLEIEAGLAWWEASTTGSEAAYSRREQADNAMAALHGDRAVFARLKALRAAGAGPLVTVVPTGHDRTVRMIAEVSDAVVCPNVRGGNRFAVAEAYRAWRDLSGDEVAALLDGLAADGLF